MGAPYLRCLDARSWLACLVHVGRTFASAFPCLWGEVAKTHTTAEQQRQALDLVQSQAFKDIVEVYAQREGIAPHPSVAYQIAVGQSSASFGKVLAVRERPTPRASTPRSRTEPPRGQPKACPAGRALGKLGKRKTPPASTPRSEKAGQRDLGKRKTPRASTPRSEKRRLVSSQRPSQRSPETR